jgi:hypothetical protein
MTWWRQSRHRRDWCEGTSYGEHKDRKWPIRTAVARSTRRTAAKRAAWPQSPTSSSQCPGLVPGETTFAHHHRAPASLP